MAPVALLGLQERCMAASRKPALRLEMLVCVLLHRAQQAEPALSYATNERFLHQRLHDVDRCGTTPGFAELTSVSAAGSVKPPSNTERKASAAFSDVFSSSHDQSKVVRNVACRPLRPALAPRSAKRSCIRSASEFTLITRMRAAASSIARGNPSSERTIRLDRDQFGRTRLERLHRSRGSLNEELCALADLERRQIERLLSRSVPTPPGS